MSTKINEIIRNQGFLLGSWINSGSPIVSEIMANTGLDFLTIDLEHSTVDLEKSLSIFQAIKAGNSNCLPFVRLAGNEYSQTKRFLDAGAEGVIAPLINSGHDAKVLLDSVKFPPVGKRGVGYGRSSSYGFDIDKYFATANEETFVCVQIEHIKAVENIDEIFSVDGIDAAFIGPYDLSASMGITAQWENKRYLDTRDLILKKCEEYNILAGVHVVQPKIEQALSMIKSGFKIIAYTLDITLIGYYYRDAVNKIKRGIK